MLLESDPNVTRCSLFHAIQQNASTAVRIICEHLQNSEVAIKVQLNAFADEDGFPRYTTPLLYASTENHFDIVKILIDFGAEFPCVKAMVSRAGPGQYDRSLARLHYCRAISSEAYLLATPDPLESAFEAGRKMKSFQKTQMASMSKEYVAIKNSLDMFSSNILMKVDDTKEMRLLLRGRFTGGQDRTGSETQVMGTKMIPKRLKEAIKLQYKLFLVNPNSQQYILEKWYSGEVDWQNMSLLAFTLWTMMVMIFNPVLSLLYIFIPTDFVQKTIRVPYMRYLLSVTSHSMFVFLLLEYTIVLIYKKSTVNVDYRTNKIGPLVVVIYLVIAGMTWREFNEVWWVGPRSYFSDWTNWVETFQLILYWISIILDIYDIATNTSKLLQQEDRLNQSMSMDASLNTSRKVDNIDNLSIDWGVFDLLLISEATFATASVLTFLALLRDFVILRFVGPLLISFVGMFADIARFMLIFLLVWISFGIGLTQLYQTIGEIEDAYCSNCEPLPFATLTGTLSVLFWSLFDATDLDNFRHYKKLYGTESVGVILYGVYMLFAVIVMLNALIAMMGNTYNRVEENSETEWTLHRTSIMMSFMIGTPTLAPPFNLIPTVKNIRSVLLRVYFKMRTNRHMLAVTHDEDTDINEQNERYQVLIRQVSERYIDELGLTSKEQGDEQINGDSVKMQESIDLMREELDEVRRETLSALHQVSECCRLLLDASSNKKKETNRSRINGPKDRPIDTSDVDGATSVEDNE